MQGDIEVIDADEAAALGLIGTTEVNELTRGCMVRINGLVSKPELNGQWALVLGDLLESGRFPVVIAPLHATEQLKQLSVKPANVVPSPQDCAALHSAWNNVAFAYKRSKLYVEAGSAYQTSLAFASPDASYATLSNMIKLSAVMAREGFATREETEVRMRELMEHLFEPITSLPELRGLDCTFGCDFVPGYAHRMVYVGIMNSVNLQPATSAFARQVVYDDNVGRHVEVHPETGQQLPLSEAAREAIALGIAGKASTIMTF